MRFVVLGGDQRHEALVDWASRNGNAVFHFTDGESLNTADLSQTGENEKTVWVLPILSLTRQQDHWSIKGFRDYPASSLISRLRDGDMLIYAELTHDVGTQWEAAYPSVHFVNLLEQEYFVSENAVLTAEGALCLAAQQSPIAFSGSNCLVIGYGHIGKVLSRYLQTLGAAVWTSARNEKDLAAIRSQGLGTVHTYNLSSVIGRQDFIFNTVPARVLGMEMIGRIQSGTLILDLASAPYGADDQQMENAGRKYQRYPGIPGKMYPVSAGRIIYNEVMNQTQATNSIET